MLVRKGRWWNKRYEIRHGKLRSDATEAKAAENRERRRNAANTPSLKGSGPCQPVPKII
jgi:hypothetical protein